MTPDRFQQIERLYHSALEHPPEEREAYLKQSCAGDEELRREVESLFAAKEPAENFIEDLAAKEAAKLFAMSSEVPASLNDLDVVRLMSPGGGPASPILPSGREAEAVTAAKAAPVVGDVIGDYEILAKIGGNMGLVFKARHRLLDKVLALKVLPAEWIADPARLARFQRELWVMGQLEHQNLVTASDARIVGCWHLVAMELIDGMDLQRLVESRGPLPVAAACEAARQAALGLQHAHEHGLIHRDIKPSNLMLTRAGAIKVIDMGLALTKEEPGARLTQTGLVLGTMSYCAPEQFRDASRVDIRADIYSLGCTLFHLLFGKPPFWQQTTFAGVVQAHLNEAFPGLAEVRPDAPPGLETVLERMTAKDPAARFATPGEVAEALGPFARGGSRKHLFSADTQQASGQAASSCGKRPQAPPRKTEKDAPRRQASAVGLTVQPGPAPAAKTDPATRTRRLHRRQRPGAGGGEGRRRWGLLVGVALVLLLVLVGGVFLAMVLWEGDPIVVLMDTTAAGGVYDEDNRVRGGTNAEELTKVLHHLLPNSLRAEAISAKWEREAQVLGMRPRLVVIHRSSFFHPLNAELQFGSPPFTNEADDARWKVLYRLADDRLRTFIGLVGMVEGRTEFLVYSRGTDVNWLDSSFREKWIKEIEDRFPTLKGRITTMLVPGGKEGTFRDPETREQIRNQVKAILGLSKPRD